jgi:hypothetical protein
VPTESPIAVPAAVPSTVPTATVPIAAPSQAPIATLSQAPITYIGGDGEECLWSTGCTSTSDCTAGTYCYYESSIFSQCREMPYECLSEDAISRAAPGAPYSRKLTDTHTPEEGSCDCIATNNGPYNGNRQGCASDSDCCNPAAECSHQQCYIPCTGDVPSASPITVGEPTASPAPIPEPCRSVYETY